MKIVPFFVFLFLFIASCSMLPKDDDMTTSASEINLETTKVQPSEGESKDVSTFNQKIISAFNKKESWATHAPEVVFQYLGRDLSASFTTIEFKSQPEKFDYSEVDLIKDGLLDDAVKSERTVITMKKLPKGYWQLLSAKSFVECYRNKEEGRCL